MRLTTLAFLLVGTCLALAGCSDDGGDTGGSGGGADEPTQPGSGYWGDNDSSQDDGSYWPKWKNPCPGPACDPPRSRYEQVSNPPPDEDDLQPQIYVRPEAPQ